MGLEAARQALRLLRAHLLRSLLTLFGLVWGTASVILLVGWGQGVNTMLERAFYKTGRNMGEAWAGTSSEEYTPAVDRRYLWYTTEDVEALRRRVRLSDRVGAEAWEMLPAAHGQRVVNVDVRGVDLDMIAIRGVGVAAGRGLTPADLEHRRRVVLLGAVMRERLLGASGGLGSWIRLGGKPFQVVGVLERVGTQLSRDRMEVDEHAWIPITTLQANWPAPWTEDRVVTKIAYRMRDSRQVEEAEREVRAILAERLGVAPDDDEAVPIWSSVAFLSQLPLEQTRGILAVLASATLMIGGIGILNMMLDAVHERRREIGVRLAVGARRRDVIAQFFLEALTVVAFGGLLGVALGVGGCLLLASLHVPELIPVPELTLETVLLALGVLGGVGLLAGVVPAWRAAQVDPAETLRME